MVGQRQRDKQQTRDRISRVATALFLEHGFDKVTVAEVAAASDVSKVTVFAHFPRKEDLLLDRAPEALDLLLSAVRDRPAGADPVRALHLLGIDLADRRHPLSGIVVGAQPFLRTLAASPALLGRARELLDELEEALASALAQDEHPVGRPRLLAALVIAAYRVVVTGTATQMLNGAPLADVVADHHRRLDDAFAMLDAAAATMDR